MQFACFLVHNTISGIPTASRNIVFRYSNQPDIMELVQAKRVMLWRSEMTPQPEWETVDELLS